MERAEGVVVAGRYRLSRKLGAGGMGSVWLAYDQSLDTRCAIKLVDDDKAKNEEVRVRFHREAKAAAQIRSPHVVDVFDHGEWSGTPYIAMEYLDGEDLGARLTRLGRLDPGSTYRVIAHVARALTRAHAVGIVHRDLKPENIFLVRGDDEEIAKVLDFGIAKHDAYALQDKATKTGSFLGTPYYVSPEQARGKSTDFRSDLWSLAVIAFECVTGKPPFQAEALGELMGQILYEAPPRPTERQPGLSPAIDEWWARASQRDREQRFQSAKDLADALGRALGVTRLVVVPSIPPRAISVTPTAGLERSSAPPPIEVPTPPALPVELRETASPHDRHSDYPSDRPNGRSSDHPSDRPSDRPSLTPATPAPARLRSLLVDEPLDSDAPLSRTRQSLAIRFPNLRRRHLFAFAGGGVVLGVLLTLILLNRSRDVDPAAGVEATPLPPAAARPEPVQREIVTPGPPAAPPPAPVVEAAPAATQDDSSKTERGENRRSGRASSTNDSGPRKRPPPAPRAKPASPDYGI